MKKYQWNSPQLKKKSSLYTVAAFFFMVLSLLLTWLSGTVDATLVLLSMGVAIVLMLLSWKVQSGDKKLKQ